MSTSLVRVADPAVHPATQPPLQLRSRPRRPSQRSAPRRRLVAAALATAALVALPAAGASAHIRVTPSATASGGYSELAFRVPNEEASASTVKVSITLPQSEPFSYVGVKPLAGWTATVTEDTLPSPVTRDGTTLTKAPHVVTWTAATGGGLKPDEYDTFSIFVGPLPSAGQLELPTTQTYSDGTVVDWAQHQAPGAAEPENPAPSFVVTASTGGGDDDSDATATPTTSSLSASAAPVVATSSAAAATSGSDPVARGLSVAALVVAVLGAAGGLAVARRRGGSS